MIEVDLSLEVTTRAVDVDFSIEVDFKEAERRRLPSSRKSLSVGVEKRPAQNVSPEGAVSPPDSLLYLNLDFVCSQAYALSIDSSKPNS